MFCWHELNTCRVTYPPLSLQTHRGRPGQVAEGMGKELGTYMLSCFVNGGTSHHTGKLALLNCSFSFPTAHSTIALNGPAVNSILNRSAGQCWVGADQLMDAYLHLPQQAQLTVSQWLTVSGILLTSYLNPVPKQLDYTNGRAPHKLGYGCCLSGLASGKFMHLMETSSFKHNFQ